MGTAQNDGIGADGSHIPIKIHNVLLSTDLPTNLISVSALYKSGYRIFDPHYGRNRNDTNLYFSNDDHIIPAYRDESGNGFWKLYHFSEPRAYSSTCEPNSNIDLWHFCFGHLNHRSTRDIIHNVMALKPYSPSTCEPCIMGKQTRASHSGSLPCSHTPLRRIHCDLAGPFPVRTRGGHLY